MILRIMIVYIFFKDSIMAKVLIADDMITVQHNLNLVLSSFGHEVVGMAKNCSEAIKIFKETKPELVILDILGMKAFDEDLGKEIDTFDTIHELLLINKNVKIIVLTASPKEEYIKKALILGAKGFLVKGVSNDKIESTVQSILNK